MDNKNWRSTQDSESAIDGGDDWRSQLQDESRKRIVDWIMDISKRHFLISGQEELLELKKIVVRFEEKIYTTATSQGDYLTKISMKMRAMETNHHIPNAMSSNSAIIGHNPQHPGSQSMRSQSNNQGLFQTDLSQSSQLLPQSIGINIASAGVQGSAGLSSALPLISSSSQQSALKLLPSQAQQSHQQMMCHQFPDVPKNAQTQQQSHMMSEIKPQPVRLQQQLVTQHQPNLLHRSMQQKLQSLRHEQLFQPQRAMPEASPTSLDSTAQAGNADGGDWQEETYQKIMSMKEMYFLDLNELCQDVAAKLHQHESLLLKQPQLHQGRNRILRAFKSLLEGFISLLQISRSNIHIEYKDKLDIYDWQITRIVQSYRSRKPIPHIGSGETMQQNVANLQHNPSSLISRISNAQRIIKNLLHPSSALGRRSINSMNSVQNVAMRPLQQNPVSVPEQASVNLFSSQSGINPLKANLNSVQPILPQQQQDQLLQNQQLKQFQHHQMQPNLMDKLLMQQRQQSKQIKLEQPARMQSNYSPINDHMSDSTDSKTRQQLSVKSSAFHRSAYQQQLNTGNQLPISSPQQLQHASPQISHQGSPQVEQQKMLITQAINVITQDETTRKSKNKRVMSSDVSSTSRLNDSLKQLNGSDLSNLDSTETSSAKKPKIEVNHALSEEIREINLLLKDTVVNISDEDADPTIMAATEVGGAGTVVKCSFSGEALSPDLKSKYASKMSPIPPIKLFIPKDYPNCSPLLFEKLSLSRGYEGLTMAARSRFLFALQSFSHPLSIKDIAKTWDICARDVISEFAQQSGGGS